MKGEFYIQPPKTPVKDILDPKTQKHIESVFPKTNDDNLQEDLAEKFVVDSDYLYKLHENEKRGEDFEKDINNELWKLYEKQIELGLYIDIHKDLNKKVSDLIDNIAAIELRSKINKNFKLEKSNITQSEVADFYTEQIDDVKKELYSITNEDIDSQSIGKIFDEYTKVVEKYNNLLKILFDIDPRSN